MEGAVVPGRQAGHFGLETGFITTKRKVAQIL